MMMGTPHIVLPLRHASDSKLLREQTESDSEDEDTDEETDDEHDTEHTMQDSSLHEDDDEQEEPGMAKSSHHKQWPDITEDEFDISLNCIQYNLKKY